MESNVATTVYVWKENLACVSAYKILVNMQQINASKTRFGAAADLKLGKLPYFPATSTSPSLLEMAAMMTARDYTKLLSRDYVVRPQAIGGTWKKLTRAMEQILADKGKSVLELAEVVDEHVKFGDE